MIVNNFILKEKSVKVNEFFPTDKMKINIARNTIMPDNVIDKTFNCVIENDISLIDDNEKELVHLKISYLVVSILESGDEYSKNQTGNDIFKYIKLIYIKTANDLLKEINYPPIPYNIGIN